MAENFVKPNAPPRRRGEESEGPHASTGCGAEVTLAELESPVQKRRKQRKKSRVGNEGASWSEGGVSGTDQTSCSKAWHEAKEVNAWYDGRDTPLPQVGETHDHPDTDAWYDGREKVQLETGETDDESLSLPPHESPAPVDVFRAARLSADLEEDLNEMTPLYTCPNQSTDETSNFQCQYPPAEWQIRHCSNVVPRTDDNSFFRPTEEYDEDSAEQDKWYLADEMFDEDSLTTEDDEEIQVTATNTDGDDDKPLYKNAPITLAESMLLILTLCLRHSLTGSCLVDLLTLVSLHCQKPNLCKTSLYFFRQYFSKLSMPLKFHTVCSHCRVLTDANSKQCSSCKSNVQKHDRKSSNFIEIPVVEQLKTLFKGKEFCDSLGYRFNRTKIVQENIEDIYDGEMYKKFSRPGQFLSDKHNISFMWYTDGIPVFRSSRFAIWPLYLAINELPPKKRLQRQNLIIAGLWYGESKPSVEIFLKPLHSTLMDMFDGITVCDHLGRDIKIRGMLLCGTCDMPAKCMVLNMTQFNGLYGCPRCMQSGEVVSVGRGHARVFPTNANNLDGPKRTHNETVQFAKQAFHHNKTIMGVKGPSWLLYLMPDAIRGTAIDWMHQVLLGIVRRLLHLWFDSSKSKEPFSIPKRVEEVDAMLDNLQPPNFISRLPRGIKEHSKYWKASECRSWLFYYSLPVLSGLLPDLYLQHYLLLVKAVYILNGDSISKDMINHCERVLKHFCMMHGTLYSPNQMTSNIHQLLHLCDVVKDLGPLWVYSCFSFESLNGDLLSLFHGTKKVTLQIANNIATLLKEPLLKSKLQFESPVGQFYLSMKGYHAGRLNYEEIDHDTHCLGKLQSYTCTREETMALDTFWGFPFSDTIQTSFALSRILKSGRTICSGRFTQTIKRNSFTVSFLHNAHMRYGQITKFVKINQMCTCTGLSACSCSSYFCFIEMFEPSLTKLSNDSITSATVQHLVPCKRNVKTLVSVPVENILSLCVFVDIAGSDTVYVAKRPNAIEGD